MEIKVRGRLQVSVAGQSLFVSAAPGLNVGVGP
jgi:hypothetical protein